MSGVRKWLAGLAAGAALLTQAAPASATNWDDWYDVSWDALGSSLSVECTMFAGSACHRLKFGLNVTGTNRLFALGIVNWRPDLWSFGSVVGLTDRYGNNLLSGWYTAVFDTDDVGLKYDAEAAAAADVSHPYSVPEPVFLTVGLSRGSSAALSLSDFGYIGTGLKGTSGSSPFYTYGNLKPVVVAPPSTATPEPVSLLLLGSGLAGVGVARRRRRADP